ncbi:putative U3 small nucleolar ribonucleoprotein LCP5 [Peziza echinospora]|nr:putative U3 small nucleolar ribonucleoprotein LCP5 [Peziza echinospora]
MAPPPPATTELPSITSLLETLTEALESTSSSLPDALKCLPPTNGISLLDLKNELMLSYIHNLVFFLLVRMRGGEDAAGCVQKLVEARTWLERGIRPVESKLRYQIDKVVKRSVEYESTANGILKKSSGAAAEESSDDEGEDADEEAASNGATRVIQSYDIDGEPTVSRKQVEAQENAPTAGALTEELSFRPNPTALARPATNEDSEDDDDRKAANPNGLYRPPRISATAMPTTALPTTTAAPTAMPRLSKKSHSLDAFIAAELSSAPAPEPSIGSTISASGRGSKSHQDRREEQDRKEYEESNFVRLPAPSKQERRKKMEHNAKFAGDQFGGEDWRGFAGDLDRLTARAIRPGRSSAALDKSRKRKEGGGGGAGGGGGNDGGDGGHSGKKARIGRKFATSVGRESKKRK